MASLDSKMTICLSPESLEKLEELLLKIEAVCERVEKAVESLDSNKRVGD